MKLKYILGITSLLLASIAAFFSIYGLSSLFSGFKLQIIIMAGSLEFAKLLIISLIYNYSKILPKIIKPYLYSALIILMLITSLGIGGYLINAYQKTSNLLEKIDIQEEYIKEKQNILLNEINNYKEEIKRNQERLKILNTQREKQENRLNKAQEILNKKLIVEARNDIIKANEEINQITKKIEEYYDKINIKNNLLNSYKDEILKLRIENKLNIDIGPLKYLSYLFKKNINEIVIYLIILLIFVFDPLAITLWLSTNILNKKEIKEININKKTKLNKNIENKENGNKNNSSFDLKTFKDYIRNFYKNFNNVNK